mgnify:CR=1 FL=1
MWQNLLLVAGVYYLFTQKMAQMQLGHTIDSVEEAERAHKQGKDASESQAVTKAKKQAMTMDAEDNFNTDLKKADKVVLKAKQEQAAEEASRHNAKQGPGDVEGVLLDVNWHRN